MRANMGRDYTTQRLQRASILLRHNFLPPVCCGIGTATGTSRQDSDERVDQPHAHGRDRVRDVAFRPQGGILWVDNLRVEQTPGMAWRDEVLRGESSPSRRPGIRRLRCTSWRDDGSRANRALRSAQAQLPASAPDSLARYASVAWRSRRVRGSRYRMAASRANIWSARSEERRVGKECRSLELVW